MVAYCRLRQDFRNFRLDRVQQLYALHIDTYANAARFALLVGLGYLVTNTVNIAINPSVPRPLFYGPITSSYHLVGTLLASLLLVGLK